MDLGGAPRKNISVQQNKNGWDQPLHSEALSDQNFDAL